MLTLSDGWASANNFRTLSATSTSPRKGPAGIKHVINKRLSPEARKTITIENDENLGH